MGADGGKVAAACYVFLCQLSSDIVCFWLCQTANAAPKLNCLPANEEFAPDSRPGCARREQAAAAAAGRIRFGIKMSKWEINNLCLGMFGGFRESAGSLSAFYRRVFAEARPERLPVARADFGVDDHNGGRGRRMILMPSKVLQNVIQFDDDDDWNKTTTADSDHRLPPAPMIETW